MKMSQKQSQVHWCRDDEGRVAVRYCVPEEYENAKWPERVSFRPMKGDLVKGVIDGKVLYAEVRAVVHLMSGELELWLQRIGNI
jgi:hypothetical protein